MAIIYFELLNMDKLAAYLGEIEKALNQYTFGSHPKELYEPVDYILSIGGKRLRPVLTLLAAACYGNHKNALYQALAVEVFHNFTLLHDDIMDQAPLRRGQATVHHKWDVNRAILSGDVMLIQAYELVVKNNQHHAAKLIDVFNKMAREVCEGQQLDMNFESHDKVSESDYLYMIERKTSVLLGCALQLGAIVSNAPASHQEALYAFGVNLGLAFQIKDDILDVFGDPAKVGKQVGGDILANKKTLLLIHALENAKENDAEELAYWLSEKSKNQEKIKAVSILYQRLKTDVYAAEKSEAYYKEAMRHLEKIDIDTLSLSAFATWLMAREH
jgi:geranylgeranyl diphosphate synthase, type II